MKAMILAAGRGERLRPLTDTLPKPLVEAGGVTLLDRHLRRLGEAGFAEAVINVSHLADSILDRYAGGGAHGVRIAWSREAAPLETAGGIAFAPFGERLGFVGLSLLEQRHFPLRQGVLHPELVKILRLLRAGRYFLIEGGVGIGVDRLQLRFVVPTLSAGIEAFPNADPAR